MVLAVAIAFFLVCTAGPVLATEVEPFDPEAPFRQGLTTGLLRSLFNQAFDQLEDHLDILGTLEPEDVKGNRQGRVQFKFYPEGKSKSGDHIAAEGSFRVAPDGRQQDWRFKFTLPKDRKQSPLRFQDPL